MMGICAVASLALCGAAKSAAAAAAGHPEDIMNASGI